MKKFFFNKKAQSSVETILITAMALFILTALTAIIFEQIYLFNENQNRQTALSAIELLVKETNDVYFLGPGSVKIIRVILPEGFVPEESFIKEKSFSLRIGESDVYSNAGVEVRGEWPIDGGNHSFVLTAFNDFVSVLETKVIVSPTQVSEYLSSGEEKEFGLELINESDFDKKYFVVIESVNEINLNNVGGEEVSVFANDSETNNFSVSCKNDAFGSFFGRIIFVPTTMDVNLSVPIKVFCLPN